MDLDDIVRETATELALFDIDPAQIIEKPAPEPKEKISADRKRTQRQLSDLARGIHPLTGYGLHAEAAPADDRDAQGRRCGTCAFRELLGYGRRSYAKCVLPNPEHRGGGRPYVTHGAATDVRAWWPACNQHHPVGGEIVQLKPKEGA